MLADLIARAAASPLTKLALGLGVGASAAISLAKTVMSAVRGTDMMPMVVRMAGQGGSGTGFLSTLGAGPQAGALAEARGKGLSDKQIQAGFGGRDARTGLANRGIAMKGAGIAVIGGIAGGLMMQSENEGVQMAGSALTGASTGAMVGMVAGPVGMAVGAAVGGGISLLMDYMSKKDEEKKKEEQRKAEEASRQLSQYDLMEQHLRKMAEQETKIYMDANEVGIAQRVGNYSVGN